MTRGESFFEKVSCKHGHCAPMTNLAWCDLNKGCTVLKLHGMCHNPKYNCQKQITFTPSDFQLEEGSIKNKLKSIFRGTQAA